MNDALFRDFEEWAMSRFQRPRKPPLVTLPEVPDYAKRAMADDERFNMAEAWEAYDQTMLLSDNNVRLAEQAFAAVRARRRQLLKRAQTTGDDDGNDGAI